ncbi:MAG: hypothetical protein IIX56_03015 [Treponema sp.]|nr:hypothetical protein [Treponema sp.]MBQ2234362.1 hypothetical protein [Treponema sp.]
MEDNLIQYKLETIDDDFSVEYEVLPTYCNQILDKRVLENNNNINEIEQEEIRLQEKLDSLNNEVDRLTNHADGMDYIIAVSCGVLCGLIDSFWVGEFNVEHFNENKEKITKQFENFVEKKGEKVRKEEQIENAIKKAKEKAKEKGKKLDKEKIEEIKKRISESLDKKYQKRKASDIENGTKTALKSALEKLQDKFKIASDNLWNGAKIHVSSETHHIDDLAHHPTLVGLSAAIISEVFRCGIFFNKKGKWSIQFSSFKNKEEFKEWVINIVVPIVISGILLWLLNVSKKKQSNDFGDEIPKPIQKVIALLAAAPAAIAVIEIIKNWLGHLISDMAGSSSSASKGRNGMGIPGLFMSMFKYISSIPILCFTGLPKVVDKIYSENRFDMRAEIATLDQLGKQAIPVLLGDVIVRTFYFIRHLIEEIKINEITGFNKDNLDKWKSVDWHKIIPFNNRTIARMITISSGTFTAIDLADATIRSAIKNGAPSNPAFWKDFVLRVNFVDIGRFAIAVGTDIGMGVKRNKLINERIECNAKIIQYQNAKIFYSESNMWVSAENVEKSMQELYKEAENCIIQVTDDYNAIQKDIKVFGKKVEALKKINPDIRERLKQRAIWGK